MVVKHPLRLSSRLVPKAMVLSYGCMTIVSYRCKIATKKLARFSREGWQSAWRQRMKRAVAGSCAKTAVEFRELRLIAAAPFPLAHGAVATATH
jgi:hypothetical protein